MKTALGNILIAKFTEQLSMMSQNTTKTKHLNSSQLSQTGSGSVTKYSSELVLDPEEERPASFKYRKGSIPNEHGINSPNVKRIPKSKVPSGARQGCHHDFHHHQ